MKHYRILTFLLLGAGVAGLVWYSSRPQPLAVDLTRVTRGEVAAKVTNTRAGTLKACRRAGLSPAQGGQVAALRVRKGDKVKADQILLELWNVDLKAQVKLAEGEATAARAKAEEACLSADIAVREARRLENLHQRQLASEEQMDRARTEVKVRAAGCHAAQAGVEVSENQVAVARAYLERSHLRAPFAGVVAEIYGEPGEFVTPSPPGIPTLPAIDLVEDGCIYVSAPIDEVDAPQVELCMPAVVTLDAFGEQRFPGNVRRIAPYVLDVEKQARTVEVEIFLEDPSATLLPGYSADVEIITATHEDVLRIPSAALLEGRQVLVYDPVTPHLQTRTVTTGLSNWQYTEITAGLKEGEQIVTSVGQEGVAAGVLAMPLNQSGPE